MTGESSKNKSVRCGGCNNIVGSGHGPDQAVWVCGAILNHKNEEVAREMKESAVDQRQRVGPSC